jgi:hypothetical protein
MRSKICRSTLWSFYSLDVTGRPTVCRTRHGPYSGAFRKGGSRCKRSAITSMTASTSAKSTRVQPKRPGELIKRGAAFAGIRSSRNRAVPLHEHTCAPLHRLSRRASKPGSSGFICLVRNLSRRPLVHIRCAPQHAAHWTHLDGARTRRH